MRIACLTDSIGTHRNGAVSTCWPRLLGNMIEDGGVFDIQVRSYGIPGLRWQTAHIPTPGFLIGGALCPLDAIKRDGCDILLVSLGVNDRQNPQATQDALALQAVLPDCRIIWVRQNMYDANGVNDSVVTQAEQAAMDAVYSALGGEGFHVGFGKLYDMGYSYDMLHPTSSGDQWIANATYMYLQQSLPLTPIARNIAWLYSQTPAVREQMRLANT